MAVISQYYSNSAALVWGNDDDANAGALDTYLSRFFYQRSNVEPAVTTFVLQSVLLTFLGDSMLVTVLYSTQSTT